MRRLRIPTVRQLIRISIDVATVSLTTGNRRRDAMLAAVGLIDHAAAPLIHYRSCVLSERDGRWKVDGMISTTRGARPLALDVAEPAAVDGSVRLHARGRISRGDIADLLARPGAAPLLGPSADLSLTVELVPP